jgi:hypothetical protein
MTDNKKECTACLKTLPLSLFDIEKSGYVRKICHSCRLEQIRKARHIKQTNAKTCIETKACVRCSVIKKFLNSINFLFPKTDLIKNAEIVQNLQGFVKTLKIVLY